MLGNVKTKTLSFLIYFENDDENIAFYKQGMKCIFKPLVLFWLNFCNPVALYCY